MIFNFCLSLTDFLFRFNSTAMYKVQTRYVEHIKVKMHYRVVKT